MTFSVILLSGLFHLIPGLTEILLYYNENQANMRLACIYLDIRYKRNFVYVTGLSSIIFSFTNLNILKWFFYSLFLFANYSYFNIIKKWYPYIS